LGARTIFAAGKLGFAANIAAGASEEPVDGLDRFGLTRPIAPQGITKIVAVIGDKPDTTRIRLAIERRLVHCGQRHAAGFGRQKGGEFGPHGGEVGAPVKFDRTASGAQQPEGAETEEANAHSCCAIAPHIGVQFFGRF
jgi:hypothetical protein